MRSNQKGPTLPPLELLRIVPLSEAARLAGMSERKLREHYRDKIVKRGLRAGMRVGDALQLTEPDTTAA